MKREAPMNIPEFATVLTAVMRHNMRLHDEGASIKDYLVPMAWGDPGLGKSDIAEAVADDLGWEMVYADLATRDPADLGGMPWVTDGRTVREGEVISISGTTGEIVVGEVPVVTPEPTGHFGTILSWADRQRRLGVRTNADLPEDAKRAREFGAEGIGLCRTEHMFLGDRLPIVQRMILADNEADESAALEQLRAQQESDFVGILEAMDGLPVTVRLLDPPLHEFLPDHEELIVKEATGKLTAEEEKLLKAAELWREANPMLGTRGCRLGILKPGLYRMQVRALMQAAVTRRQQGGNPIVEIMIPLIVSEPELALLEQWVREEADAVLAEAKVDLPYLVGTMVETPRAALVADRIAQTAQFFSFGTNDLTQMTFGFSRDDVEGRFMAQYLELKLLAANPFEKLDVEGVGQLVRLGCERGRAARPDLKLGICGEHGGDPESVAFCHEVGLDYVSCSPFRVPIARLAAAQAALGTATSTA